MLVLAIDVIPIKCLDHFLKEEPLFQPYTYKEDCHSYLIHILYLICSIHIIAHYSLLWWDSLFALQGGDEIDDIFGCSTVDNAFPGNNIDIADTYNVAGGDRQNVGDDSGEVIESLPISLYCK